MELQDEFGVDIPDADAERVRTIGQAVDYRSSRADPNRWTPEQIERRVIEIAACVFRVPAERIRRGPDIVDDLGAD